MQSIPPTTLAALSKRDIAAEGATISFFMSNVRHLRLVLSIAASIGAGLGCETRGAEPLAVGTLERDRLELIAEQQETIVAIHVKEGDRVEIGDLLVELDPRRMEARIASAMAARSRAAALLAKLTEGTRPEEILEARARLARAQAAIREAEPEVERVRKLHDQGIASESLLDRTEALHADAIANHDAQAARLERLLNGARIEDLDEARAAVAEAEAEMRQLELDAEKLRVVATRAGRVDALPFELGEQPPRGGVVVVLLAEGKPYARVYVPAELRPQVKPDTAATVTIEGVDGAFNGRVRMVSAEAAFTPFFALTERDRGRLTYLAEIDLTDEIAQDLPTGLPVEVRFPAAQAETR